MTIPEVRCSLVRDSSGIKHDGRNPADTPAAIVEIMRAYIDSPDREHFVMLAVDCRHRILGINTVSIGTLSASLVHPREVFKPAILLNAAAIVIAHNHPGGDPAPSMEDRDATRRLSEAGRILGIPLLDHVILGEGETFYSIKEAGLMG